MSLTLEVQYHHERDSNSKRPDRASSEELQVKRLALLL